MKELEATELRTLIREAGYTLKSFAAAVKMDYLALYRRLAGDVDFTLEESIRIADVLKLTNEQVLAIFFCRCSS